MTVQHNELRSGLLRDQTNAARLRARPSIAARLSALLAALWRRPARPPTVPHYLRADLGLPQEAHPVDWRTVPFDPKLPIVRRPRR